MPLVNNGTPLYSVPIIDQYSGAPTKMVELVRIGIQGSAYSARLNSSLKNPEAVAYIQKYGQDDAKRLGQYLEACRGPFVKIRSSIAKGQGFGFKNYMECYEACTMISWQYERVEAFQAMIGFESANWENPEVQEQLGKVLSIDSSDIKKHLDDR